MVKAEAIGVYSAALDKEARSFYRLLGSFSGVLPSSLSVLDNQEGISTATSADFRDSRYHLSRRSSMSGIHQKNSKTNENF